MGWSYAPDLPTEAPNTWRVIDGFHPTPSGAYRTGWLAGASNITATGAAVGFSYGFAYRNVAGTPQAVLLYYADPTAAAATTKSYVWDGTNWNDRNGANSGRGTCFVQVGNITLVGGRKPTLSAPGGLTGLVQRDASGTANFAAVASSPNAGVLAVNSFNIVMALDTESDAYAFSDTSAPTLWTGGESTSGNCRLTPGTFTAGAAFGNDFICFKDKGVYRASYVGGVAKWVFTLLDSEKGAWGPGCAVAGDGRVFFIGRGGVWAFDGSGFERLDLGVWSSVQRGIGSWDALATVYPETKLVWDPITRNVYFFILGMAPYILSAFSTRLGANRFYSYNVISKRWGYQGRLSEDSSNSLPAVFDLGPLNDYVLFASSGGPRYATNVGFFSGTNDRIEALTTNFSASALPGTNYKPNLRSYRLGVRDKMTSITRFIPHWTVEDGAGSDLSTATVKEATFYHADSVMEGNATGNTVTLSTDQYRADNLKSARWHNIEIRINAPAVIDGGTWVATMAGTD